MPMAAGHRLRSDDALLVVVDIQERLLPKIEDGQSVAEAAIRLIRAARVLDVPILVTEQYPKGIGPTVGPIREAVGEGLGRPIEKMTFGCGGAPEFVSALAAANRTRVLLVGIEAHVCVQQTALDLLDLGYVPFVCADAVGSRRRIDRDTAIDRMRQAGAVITTTESAIFELAVRAGTESFRELLKIVK